jgi:aspartyl-tRNA(Asn)/glutamyl-tRNA(Gln) amidotransferase subunit A
MSSELSISQMASALRSGAVKSEQLVRDALARVDMNDSRVHAFIRLDAENALNQAKCADVRLRERGAENLPVLHGIPVAVKDIYDLAGQPTTCHSKLRLDHVAQQDADSVKRLKDAGAIVLGKLATHEFALGGPSFDLPFPPARNPWNLSHIPGGSSSGSGAAIAAGYVRLALGSCTGGSIRIPAAWCGVVGLKPTYGRISRHGVVPLAWTLDHCGPLARSVEDAAIALQVLAGHDPQDPGSADEPVDDYCSTLDAGVRGLRIGVPHSHFQHLAQTSGEFLQAFERVSQCLKQAQADIVEVRLPADDQCVAAGRVILAAESFALHAKDLRSRPLDYGQITLSRLVQGAALPSEDYLNALRLRRELAARMDAEFERCDVVLTAVTLDTAPPFAAAGTAYAWPAQTYAFNVTGHPAISVPIGLSTQGLPMAVQVVGRYFDEARVLQVARAIERLSGWENQPFPELDA